VFPVRSGNVVRNAALPKPLMAVVTSPRRVWIQGTVIFEHRRLGKDARRQVSLSLQRPWLQVRQFVPHGHEFFGRTRMDANSSIELPLDRAALQRNSDALHDRR
jgi:hypothetical protein